MTAIRRYIEPPRWWSQDEIDASVVPFIKSVEQLCLDAGLVKSDLIDNMDTDNISLPSFPATTSIRYDNVCTKKLSFDLNDSMQSQLPIRIEFTFGYYTYNTSSQGSTYYPYYNYIKIRVGIINANNTMSVFRDFSNTKVRSASSTISDSYMKSRDGFPPYTYFSGMDSFICVRDGFVAINILPDYSQSDNTSTQNTTEVFFAIERSFDENNTPTADNINLISPNTTSVDTSNMLYTYVMSLTADVYSTSDTMNYFPLPSQYSEGKIILYPFSHMNSNYTMQQSPNFCGIDSNVLSPTVEVDVSVGDNPPSKFIRTSNNASSNYPVSTRCAAMFKFE